MIRLDKYLSDMGIGTRSTIKEYIRKSRITLNDKIVIRPDIKIDIINDVVRFDDKVVNYKEFQYYMLNKPAGVITATKDNNHKTVMQLITDASRKDMFPVGRLDIDTEGLLLVTNDGELAHNLLAPGRHVPKTYYARINGRVCDEHIVMFEQGIKVDKDFTALPAKLVICKSDDISEIRITIEEGKFHQIKRMFEAVGMKVLYLKRESMGKLVLDKSLELGEYRELSDEEVRILKDERHI